MPEFQYKKLVRDLIPAKHVARGHAVSGRQLTGQDLKAALIEKLHEEADEVGSALSRDELIEEIGDVQQVINDLCTTQSISPEDLAQSMAIKAEGRGGFANGLFIDSVMMPNEDDKWVKYCRKFPEKYPEID